MRHTWASLYELQLEVEHTVSLHLRSRRVGSDEAVYSTIDLLSTLLARLGGRSEEIFEDASPGRRMRHAVIQQALDTAVGVLQSSPMAHLVRPCPYFPIGCRPQSAFEANSVCCLYGHG